MKKLIALLLFGFMNSASHAQDGIEMADTMRSEGKIYVVIAVVLIILLGLLLYVIKMDRKISHLEEKMKK